MDDLLKRPYAALSNKGAKKYVHEGRIYVKNRDLKGSNKGKVLAECDQRAIGCKGRAWFYEGGQFIKMLAMVKKAVKTWKEIVPMDYLSGIAYNVRMAQGPYQFTEAQEELELLIFNEKVPEDKRNHAGDVLELNQSNDQVIVTRLGIDLTKKNHSRLETGCWINDNLVKFYLELIKDRSILNSYPPKVYVYNNQFYEKLTRNQSFSMKGWGDQSDIFECDVLLVPVHRADHWALVVVKMKKERLLYHDSLHGDGSSCLILIKEYLQVKSSKNRNSTMDPINWLGLNDKSVPQQTNGFDCGVFVCHFAESVSRDIRP